MSTKTLGLILCCGLLMLPLWADAATVQLAWTAPTTNDDGSPLTDLGRFYVYQRVGSEPYGPPMDVGQATSVSLNLAAGHTYVWVVTAIDTSSNESDRSNEVSKTIDPAPVDTTKPVVSITAPTQGATVPRKGTVTISAQATDDSGVVAQVQLFVNGDVQCTRTQTPYNCTWNVPAAGGNRQYTLHAQARDPSSNVGQSAPVVVTAR